MTARAQRGGGWCVVCFASFSATCALVLQAPSAARPSPRRPRPRRLPRAAAASMSSSSCPDHVPCSVVAAAAIAPRLPVFAQPDTLWPRPSLAVPARPSSSCPPSDFLLVHDHEWCLSRDVMVALPQSFYVRVLRFTAGEVLASCVRMPIVRSCGPWLVVDFLMWRLADERDHVHMWIPARPRAKRP